MSRARLLVLGGTGRLAAMLRRWDTGAFDIRWSARPGRAAPSPDLVVFDTRTDPAALAAACGWADAVLDLSGPTTNPARAGAGFGAIPELARAVGHAAAGKPLLWMSSAAVYGAREGARESDPPAPLSDYGRAKCRGEAVLAGRPGVSILRLGNVAGADALLGEVRPGRAVTLDRFADGATPKRAYIGPKTLVETLFSLVERVMTGAALPQVLNLSAPGGGVEMAELLDAAGLDWRPRPAPETALRGVTLETAALRALVEMPADSGTAAALVAEWRADLARGARA